MRGKIPQAPISAPASPTRVNRNAVFASGVAILRSEAIAKIAPAPAQTPSTAAMTGCGHLRIALTNIAGHAGEGDQVRHRHAGGAGSMISKTSPPEQKLPPLPCQEATTPDIRGVREVAKRGRANSA